MTNEETIQAQLEQQRAWHQQMQEQDRASQAPTSPSQKMGWGIFLVALVLSIIADLIDAFTLGTLGWLTGLFVDFLLLLLIGLSGSARKQWKKWVTAIVGEKIPFINILPLRTVFVIWSFIASRSTVLQTLPLPHTK